MRRLADFLSTRQSKTSNLQKRLNQDFRMKRKQTAVTNIINRQRMVLKTYINLRFSSEVTVKILHKVFLKNKGRLRKVLIKRIHPVVNSSGKKRCLYYIF